MANKFARANGDFNNAAIWSLLAGSMSATTVPTIGDNAIANTYTIQITGNVACDKVQVLATGGLFGLNNGAVLNAIVEAPLTGGGVGGSLETVLLSGNNSATINGNCIFAVGGNFNVGIKVLSTGTLTYTGDVLRNNPAIGQNGTHGILLSSAGTLIATSSIIQGGLGGGGNISSGIVNALNGNVLITGNVFGGTGSSNTSSGITNNSTGYAKVIGNVSCSPTTSSPGVFQNSTGKIDITGNVSANNFGSGIVSANANAINNVSGNLLGAPNGIPAVYAAAYTVNPIPSQSYIRYANNGTGVGSDAYLYHYTTDSLSAFSIPPVSAVRAGLQYANNTLTGTCEMPAASAVTFGALVDNTTGTAAITNNTLFDVSVASLTATDSLGARLKNSATVESVGKIIASFSN